MDSSAPCPKLPSVKESIPSVLLSFPRIRALLITVVATQKSLQIQETYTLLASLVGENNVIAGEFQRNELREGEFLSAYTSASGEQRRDLMTKLKEGSKKFLEGQFMNYVEKTLAAKPTEAQLGGIPTVDNKIRGFLNVKYYKNGSWSGGVEVSFSYPLGTLI